MRAEDDIKVLKNVIKQMLTPLKDIPLSLVITAISDYEIIAFDKESDKDKLVLEKLKQVAAAAGKTINDNGGILRSRPNEVGNDIEPFVIDALNKIKYSARKPPTRTGKDQMAGYPDILFKDEFDRINYLECKTFNIKTINTTLRTFYLSPSSDFKVNINAHHFLISYEIEHQGNSGNNHIYKCKSWKLLSLENLMVDVKYEFQSDNKRLYVKSEILAEGDL